jgi:hypothetical protein
MTNTPPIYVLDANVFIEAQRRYYAFDLCPGFWECLLHHHHAARIISVDRVRDEISPGDELETWAKTTAPGGFFASTADAAVVQHFMAIMQWVQSQAQFKVEARAEFAQVADGWLVAYARAYGGIVVTHEEYAPDARKRVKIPNVCKQFEVAYTDTFAMLRDLQARFDWTAP